jgi:glycosyltransferase involved in cell wall biosynthesis
MDLTSTEYVNPIKGIAHDRGCDVILRASVPSDRVTLSVVIPNFNTAEYIVAAVQSVLQQTFPHLEVIVVDDGSSDDSLRQILSIKDERLTCIRQPNRGLAGARNTGLLFARGLYVGFLDSDDIWFPKKAEQHLAVMENDPQLGLTFSHSAYLDQSGCLTGQFLISRCIRPVTRDLIRRNHVGNGSTPILRLACLEVAGGFDETMQNCEEWELWVRVAARTNFGIQLIPEVLTGYRIRQGSLSVSYDHFIANGNLAVERFRDYVPGFSDADARRAEAQNCRIASRKALSSGDINLFRRLFARAFRLCPALVLCDLRAAGLALVYGSTLLLPSRIALFAYRAALRVMSFLFSLFFSEVSPLNRTTGKKL